jgi:hypothetical protein
VCIIALFFVVMLVLCVCVVLMLVVASARSAGASTSSIPYYHLPLQYPKSLPARFVCLHGSHGMACPPVCTSACSHTPHTSHIHIHTQHGEEQQRLRLWRAAGGKKSSTKLGFGFGFWGERKKRTSKVGLSDGGDEAGGGAGGGGSGGGGGGGGGGGRGGSLVKRLSRKLSSAVVGGAASSGDGLGDEEEASNLVRQRQQKRARGDTPRSRDEKRERTIQFKQTDGFAISLVHFKPQRVYVSTTCARPLNLSRYNHGRMQKRTR